MQRMPETTAMQQQKRDEKKNFSNIQIVLIFVIFALLSSHCWYFHLTACCMCLQLGDWERCPGNHSDGMTHASPTKKKTGTKRGKCANWNSSIAEHIFHYYYYFLFPLSSSKCTHALFFQLCILSFYGQGRRKKETSAVIFIHNAFFGRIIYIRGRYAFTARFNALNACATAYTILNSKLKTVIEQLHEM